MEGTALALGKQRPEEKPDDSFHGRLNVWSKWVPVLYTHIFKTDISEEDLQISLGLVEEQHVTRTKRTFNETRISDKIKIHLIRQGRERDAKNFVRLHQQLKKTSYIQNREGILEFLYLMFDKSPTCASYADKSDRLKAKLAVEVLPPSEDEINKNDPQQVQNGVNGSPSRAAVTGVRAAVATYGDKLMTMNSSPNISRNSINSQTNMNDSPRKSELEERPNVTLRRSGRHDHSTAFNSTTSTMRDTDSVDYGTVNESFPPSRSKSHTLSARGRGVEVDSFQEFEAIPIPRLESVTDEVTREAIHRSSNRIPSLTASNLATPASVFEPPASSTQCKIISFPPNHTRHMLGSTSNVSSVNPFGGFPLGQQRSGRSTGSGGLPCESFPNKISSTSQNRVVTKQAAYEKDLIKDLIYIFQGINGDILKSKSGDKYDIALGAMPSLQVPLKLQALRLCELGHSYKKVKSWCDKPSTELMQLGFKHALERELMEYYRLLAVMQTMIQHTDVDTPMTEDQSRTGEDLTMLKLTVWIYDCRVRMDLLASIIETCDGAKGGELCSFIYRYTQHGDPSFSSLAISLLSVAVKPMYIMLVQWIMYGELEDPHNEFFIAADPECKMEQLWHSMYRIREKMLPSFISKSSAERILATGKNINFLKNVCQNNKGYKGREELRVLLEESPVECIFLEDDRILNNAIEKAYSTTSEMALKVLLHDARLLDHLKAIKHYLLLGQGDFIQYLLELLQDELNKPASKVFTHNLSSILESAVRATNAQFEDEEILARLDTRILLSNDSDLGWDVFCLDYKAHGPIGTVLTEDVIDSYNKLFNTLWKIKRIEAMLSKLWKSQATLFKFQKAIPELGVVLHRSQLLISEMIHFVHQTQYYIMFEATECAWDHLMKKVAGARDLDEVIKAHADFIQTITQRSLLDFSKRELMSQLRAIFGYVHELKDFLAEFDEKVMVELKRRKQRNAAVLEVDANKAFFTTCLSHSKAKIEALYERTQDMVRSFLLLLNRLQDGDSLTLQCLSFRLDFNEYYVKKDSRLSFPLTYQHRRLSTNAFSPCASANESATGIRGSNVVPTSAISISEDLEY